MYAKQTQDGVQIARTQIEPDWVEVTDYPQDRTYRNAWVLNGTVIEIDQVKAKQIDEDEHYKNTIEYKLASIGLTVDELKEAIRGTN